MILRGVLVLVSVHKHTIEVFIKQVLGSIELFGRVFLYPLKLVFLAHGLVLVYAEGVVGEDFDALNHLVVLEMLAQGTDVNSGSG